MPNCVCGRLYHSQEWLGHHMERCEVYHRMNAEETATREVEPRDCFCLTCGEPVTRSEAGAHWAEDHTVEPTTNEALWGTPGRE